MKYDPQKHRRRTIRLQGYDYSSPGAYFITICTHQRECLFGEVLGGLVDLNQTGAWVQTCWQNLPSHFSNIGLDAFVVMPNHLHGILWLGGDRPRRGEAFAPRFSHDGKNFDANASPLQTNGIRPQSLGAIIQNFKSVSTRKTNQITGNTGKTLWQRNYYEHIIRSEKSLQYIRQYIHHNPIAWNQDQLHPDNPSKW